MIKNDFNLITLKMTAVSLILDINSKFSDVYAAVGFDEYEKFLSTISAHEKKDIIINRVRSIAGCTGIISAKFLRAINECYNNDREFYEKVMTFITLYDIFGNKLDMDMVDEFKKINTVILTDLMNKYYGSCDTVKLFVIYARAEDKVRGRIVWKKMTDYEMNFVNEIAEQDVHVRKMSEIFKNIDILSKLIDVF